MLVKVNSVHSSNEMVNVTRLDIDDYGSVIPCEELELQLPSNDNSIIKILKNSQYAVLTLQESSDKNDGTIIYASTMTLNELNKEKQMTIDDVDKKG